MRLDILFGERGIDIDHIGSSVQFSSIVDLVTFLFGELMLFVSTKVDKDCLLSLADWSDTVDKESIYLHNILPSFDVGNF